MCHAPCVQRSLIQLSLRFLGDLAYPPKCPLCDSFVQSRDSACPQCEPYIQRFRSDAHIELPGRIWISYARSCFAYDGRVRDALQAMKYSKRLDLARFFGREMASEAREMGPFDLLACVPMACARIRGRGYNPAALLSRAVAKSCGVPFAPGVLRRSRDAAPQVGLPREERVRNVVGAFEVSRAADARIDGARVLLIDDVLTTGATANDCARALSKAGADEICVLTAARAL